MEYKQVIAVRTELKMSRGKTCAQVAHASLGSAEKARESKREWYEAWRKEGQKKVIVDGGSKNEIFKLLESAKALGLPYFLVEDAGLTELEPGTITALGIGPAPNEIVDKVTGHLHLLG
jgi:PTH2 family peptidyl-tRNA hydrolase